MCQVGQREGAVLSSNDDMMAKPPEYMEQRIAGTQEDMANYVQQCKRELRDCMLQIYLKIAQAVYNDKSEVSQEITSEAVRCFEIYFNSMKGATNLSEDDVRAAVVNEMQVQGSFYSRLGEIADEFTSNSVAFEILEPGKVYSDPMWNTGVCAGTSIRIANMAYLYAAPACAAKTYDYMALRQDPVAAQIIYLDDCLILYAQHDQNLGEAFWQTYRNLFDKPKDVKEDFPDVWAAVVAGNTLLLDAEDALPDTELERLMQKYGVAGVIMANSSTFAARLYVGERQPSKLDYEIADVY